MIKMHSPAFWIAFVFAAFMVYDMYLTFRWLGYRKNDLDAQNTKLKIGLTTLVAVVLMSVMTVAEMLR